MDGQTSGTNENVENKEEVDPWAAAFAALEQDTQKDSQADSDIRAVDGDTAVGDTSGASGQELPDKDETDNSDASEESVGRSDSDVGGADSQDNVFAESYGLDESGIQKLQEDFDKRINNKVITDVAQEFIKRGYKNNNGILGVTINDPSIRKNDEDGVPHFYNLYTGEEIRGENPRARCQELIDDYNSNLATAFNEACSQYEAFLRKHEEPMLAVKKFAPKYEKLDQIRQKMFDNIIEDYEIRDDDDKVIGYSCDLDKALELVNRQVSTIQEYAKNRQQEQPAQQQPSGPALDMKTSSGAVQHGDLPPVTSLAEAMERLQDEELAKIKR